MWSDRHQEAGDTLRHGAGGRKGESDSPSHSSLIFQEPGHLPGRGSQLSAREERVLASSYGGGETGLLAGVERRLCLCLRRPPGLDAACWGGAVSAFLLLVAMASPFWLVGFCYWNWFTIGCICFLLAMHTIQVSWEDTQSPFVRMGPWEACFYRCCHGWGWVVT